MPIIGLTDRPAAFPQVGTLRKGAPKPERGPGRDLSYFRFDTDDAEAAHLFQEAYGNEPAQISIYLPYATADECFQAWKEAWGKGSLDHRCDGQTCVRWRKPDGTYSDDPKPCPGGCKQVGRLAVIIPALRRFAYVVAQTTSIHDIIAIHEQLLALQALRGNLQGVPMLLSRRPREISMPKPDGSRVRVEKWLLSIEADPAWVSLQLTAMERQALGGTADRPLLTTSQGMTVDTLTGEILDDEADEGPAEPPKAPPASTKRAEAMRKRCREIIRELADMGRPTSHIVALNFDEMDELTLERYGKELRTTLEAAQQPAEATFEPEAAA